MMDAVAAFASGVFVAIVKKGSSEGGVPEGRLSPKYEILSVSRYDRQSKLKGLNAVQISKIQNRTQPVRKIHGAASRPNVHENIAIGNRMAAPITIMRIDPKNGSDSQAFFGVLKLTPSAVLYPSAFSLVETSTGLRVWS
jgi:hypothetical protein